MRQSAVDALRGKFPRRALYARSLAPFPQSGDLHAVGGCRHIDRGFGVKRPHRGLVAGNEGCLEPGKRAGLGGRGLRVVGGIRHGRIACNG